METARGATGQLRGVVKRADELGSRDDVDVVKDRQGTRR